MNSCNKKEEFEISRFSVSPASKVDWLGSETPLLGEQILAEGALLPETKLVDSRMNDYTLKEGER